MTLAEQFADIIRLAGLTPEKPYIDPDGNVQVCSRETWGQATYNAVRAHLYTTGRFIWICLPDIHYAAYWPEGSAGPA